MKWTSEPSQRDQEIYQAVAISLRPQQEVAELFGVSQGRVSQICRQLREWLNVQVHGGASPAEDNFIAAHEVRLRLEERMRTASEVFEQSRQQDVTEKYRRTSQTAKPDVVVEEQITRTGRPSHQMFREMVRLDELHFQARIRESQFKAELVAGESQSRWWRAEALVQRCLGLCRQVVMVYGSAIEAGVALSPLPQFELASLQASLRQRVSECELAEDLASYLPAEWAVVARELGLVEEVGEAAETENSDAEVMDNTHLVNSANNANTNEIVVESPLIKEADKVVNRANNTNNANKCDQPIASPQAKAPVSTHLSPRDVRPRNGETKPAAVPRHHSESDDHQPDAAWSRVREAHHARADLVAA